jgi:hypothetical protein
MGNSLLELSRITKFCGKIELQSFVIVEYTAKGQRTKMNILQAHMKTTFKLHLIHKDEKKETTVLMTKNDNEFLLTHESHQ